MTLLPFATVDDLQILAPAASDDAARLAVDVISGVIRGRSGVGWQVDRMLGATYTRLTTGARPSWHYRQAAGLSTQGPYSVTLPAMNLTAIASVVVDDRTLGESEWDATASGIVYLSSPPSRSVSVTYDAGYPRAPVDEAPGEFRQVCLDMAAQWVDNPTGALMSYTLGQAGERFDTAAATAAVAGDARLDPYRVNLL